MGLIEQAAKRLEELRRAGIEVPPEAERVAPLAPQSPAPAASHDPIPMAPARQEAPERRPAPKAPATSISIDLARLAALGFITPEAPRSQIADEFRILKRPLVANATAKPPAAIRNGNLVMVTSAIPGEGKTFTSVNLAMSLAMELDRTVLLVDGDVARPSVPKTLAIGAHPGLLDLLSGSGGDPQSLILGTNVRGLSLLCAGTQHPRAAEMLASGNMSRLLETLSRSDPDRIVVFDSPPLLATTESRQLATYMGQILMVVHAETTRQLDVMNALAMIEACPVKLLMLNAVTSASQGSYGYGYGYGK